MRRAVARGGRPENWSERVAGCGPVLNITSEISGSGPRRYEGATGVLWPRSSRSASCRRGHESGLFIGGFGRNLLCRMAPEREPLRLYEQSSLAFHRRFGTSYCYNRGGGGGGDPAPLFAACGSAPFTLITQLGGLISPRLSRGAKELKGVRRRRRERRH